MTEKEVTSVLLEMESDPSLITRPAFTTNSIRWPENRMPFVQYHIYYLQTHKRVQPAGYLSNLRLMLKRRD